MSNTQHSASQVSPGEALRSARVNAPNHEVRKQQAAARALGISRQSLYAYEAGTREIPKPVLMAAAQVFSASVEQLSDGTSPMRVAETTKAYSFQGMTKGIPDFKNEGEKVAFTIGVVLMANAAHVELGRCLDTAMNGLLAPITSPAGSPVAPQPDPDAHAKRAVHQQVKSSRAAEPAPKSRRRAK